MEYLLKWIPVMMFLIVVLSAVYLKRLRWRPSYSSIAIILGIKDQEEKIEGVIRSLITHLTGMENIELIIVDLFSQDDTAQIVQKLHTKYPIFKFIQSSSTTSVITLCTGQVVCLLEIGERLSPSDAIGAIRWIIHKKM